MYKVRLAARRGRREEHRGRRPPTHNISLFFSFSRIVKLPPCFAIPRVLSLAVEGVSYTVTEYKMVGSISEKGMVSWYVHERSTKASSLLLRVIRLRPRHPLKVSSLLAPSEKSFCLCCSLVASWWMPNLQISFSSGREREGEKQRLGILHYVLGVRGKQFIGRKPVRE